MMSIKLSDIAILNIECCDYRSIISLISKNEAINLMENADLNKKKVKPLHIRLPKTTAYVKSYEGKTKWMYF